MRGSLITAAAWLAGPLGLGSVEPRPRRLFGRGRRGAGQPTGAGAPSQSSNRVSPSWAFSPGSRLSLVSVAPK